MHMHKPFIRIRHLLAIMLMVALLSSIAVVPAQAADPNDIETAIEKGLEKLADMQNTDGSWGDEGWAASHPIASTCLALVKLQERAYELNDPDIENPFDPDYEYSDEILDGWEFVLNAAEILKEAIPVQNAGDPDWNGNGYGLDFATSATPVERYGYTQGIVLMALASTGTPDRENEAGLDYTEDGNADTYLELAQDVAEHIAYGQVDFGSDRGGWHYSKCNNGTCSADNSVTGYTVLGLAYAEDFGVTLPAFVKTEQNVWINSVQNADGGSMYTPPSGDSNILRTGNLIFEMTFVDGAAAPATARFQSALAYIENTWQNTTTNVGWRYSLDPADYQAMYTLMKGLEYSGIDLIDTEGGGGDRDDDWFNQEPPRSPAQDFASVLVEQQNADGSWPGTCHQYGTPHLCQIWALLILEKVSPPPPVNVEVVIPKCACDDDGYEVNVTYTVENAVVDGTLVVKKDGVEYDTVILTGFTGTATETYDIASDTPGSHTWRADLDVAVPGGLPAHADDEATLNVCETPEVLDIPDQTAPFETFDLDDYLVYGGGGGGVFSWSVSGVPVDWTVVIDAENVVTVTAPEGAMDPATLTFTASVACCNGVVCSDSDDATFIPNQPPDCSEAYADPGCLWPPNHKFVDISIMGVTDPDNDPVTITVMAIRSDEPTATDEGSGGAKHAPDAYGVGTDTASVRAERSGNGDGRIYVIKFIASDGRGGECEGKVIVKVPHDQSDKTCPAIWSGPPSYDATGIN